MKSIQNKIDFAVIFSVNHANPNGDPLFGNRPRTIQQGFGEVSDVCIKRKIRDRWQDAGTAIYVQVDDKRVDDYRSLRERAEGELKGAAKDKAGYRQAACEKWLDVRAFGQVFAFSGSKKKKGAGDAGDDENSVAIGIRGPVSIHPAFSVVPVNVTSIQITKSVSGEGDGSKRGSDTMGMKHRINHGVYVFYGSINPQLATQTGFSEEDAEALKTSLINLFENDASSARPEGSMAVEKVFWWKHNCNNGQYSSAKVHRSLQVKVLNPDAEPKAFPEDYTVSLEKLPGLEPEIYEGR